MLKLLACMAATGLAVVPAIAVAQTDMAPNARMPVPAEVSAVGEPVVADGLMPRAAGANQYGDRPVSTGMLGLGEVKLVYAPQPSRYQPEGRSDMVSPSQPVQVACLVGSGGHMQNCAVRADARHDPKAAELALADVSQFVVGSSTRDGEATIGQTLVVTCQFQPLDDGSGRQDLASN